MAVRKIKDIYTGYFQKSKVFLHPALGHKRGVSVNPIETYLNWKGIVELNEPKLACLYHLRDDEEFLKFEENMLLRNPLFEDFKEVANNKAVYMFNLEKYAEDYFHFLSGRYSKLSQSLKTQIKEHYGASTANYAFIDSYLYPENYIELYADFLCPDKSDIPVIRKLLEDVGELCSYPNIELEELKVPIKVLDLKKNY